MAIVFSPNHCLEFIRRPLHEARVNLDPIQFDLADAVDSLRVARLQNFRLVLQLVELHIVHF